MKKTLFQIGCILAISALLAGLANSMHPRRIPWVQNWSQYVEAKAKQKEINVIPLRAAFEKYQSGNVVFVDARPKEEYEIGHIPDAISLPFRKMDESFEVLERLLLAERPMVLYCSTRECDDALLLASEMKAMGVTNLYLYVDGFESWNKYGGAVEQGSDGGITE